MSAISFKETKDINQESLIKLYNDAGWTSYTKEPEKLTEALKNSLYVASAWDNDILAGLIRVVGDGLTIIYIQDILVLNSYKRRKIASGLITKTLNKYSDVRQKVLLTDDKPETKAFYQATGFLSANEMGLISYIKFEF